MAVYMVLLAVAVFLQVVLVPYIEILYWRPDLVLIVLVLFSVQFGQAAGSTAGFVVGLVGDMLSAHIIGLGALVKTVAGFLAVTFSRFFQEHGQFVFTLMLTGFVHDAIYFFVDTLGKGFSWQLIIFVYILPRLFYTTLVGAFIYFLVGNWLREL